MIKNIKCQVGFTFLKVYVVLYESHTVPFFYLFNEKWMVLAHIKRGIMDGCVIDM